MTYECKECGKELTEFDIGLERELKGKANLKACACKHCNLKDEPMGWIDYPLWKEIGRGFVFLVSPLLIIMVAISIISVGFFNRERAQTEIAMLITINILLQILVCLFVYNTGIANGFDETYYSNIKDYKGIILFFAYLFFDIWIIFENFVPDVSLIDFFGVFFWSIFMMAIEGFSLYVWLNMGTKAVLGYFNIDDPVVEINRHYETKVEYTPDIWDSSKVNAKATTRETSDYAGGGFASFIRWTVTIWGLPFWIGKSLWLLVSIPVRISMYADKEKVKAYRKTCKKYPKIDFKKGEVFRKEQEEYERKVNNIKERYSKIGNNVVNRKINEIKEPEAHNEKVNGILYYDIQNINGVVFATYQKKGKEISVKIVDGEIVYNDSPNVF